MRVERLLVGLAVLACAAPALAEGPSDHAAEAPATDQAAGLPSAFEASIALVADEHAAKAEESRMPAEARHLPTKTCSIGSSCSYRKVLSYLVITRDIQVPGAPEMALRLIPTSSALAGDSHSRIVVRPRVVGSGWYGLDVAARF